ncbi:MAG: hypothetical protein P8O99_01205 [Pseudomonadales bacterium]|nr:hypothetical protein [Pseudomonadales bacterium]
MKKTDMKKATKTQSIKASKESTAAVDLAFIGSKDEVAETRNTASRERVRSVLDDEVAKFLNGGGKINNVAANVMGDPPRKPESNYGSRPI